MSARDIKSMRGFRTWGPHPQRQASPKKVTVWPAIFFPDTSISFRGRYTAGIPNRSEIACAAAPIRKRYPSAIVSGKPGTCFRLNQKKMSSVPGSAQ